MKLLSGPAAQDLQAVSGLRPGAAYRIGGAAASDDGAATPSMVAVPTYGMAPFLTHLIATAQGAPQTRGRRRADPGRAISAYAAAEQRLASGAAVRQRQR